MKSSYNLMPTLQQILTADTLSSITFENGNKQALNTCTHKIVKCLASADGKCSKINLISEDLLLIVTFSTLHICPSQIPQNSLLHLA